MKPIKFFGILLNFSIDLSYLKTIFRIVEYNIENDDNIIIFCRYLLSLFFSF